MSVDRETRYQTARRGERARLVTAALLISFATVLSGCGATSRPTAVIKQARQAEASGNYRTATIKLKNLIKRKPKNRAAWLLLGQVTLSHGSAADAQSDLEHAKKLGASADQVLVPLGRSLLAQQEPKQVLDEVSVSAVTKPALKAQVMVLRGDAYLAAGQVAHAQAAYSDALKFKSGLPIAYVGLARTQGASGNTNAAKANLQKAFAHAPDLPKAWIVKGELEIRQNDFPAAEKSFKHALKVGAKSLLPTDIFLVRTRIAAAQVHQKKYKQALPNLKALEKLSPDTPYPRYLRSVVAYRQQDYDTAAQNLQQILQNAPHNVPAQLLLGVVNYSRKDYPQTDMYLSNVLGIDPNNVAARKLLSVTLLKEGQPDQAVNVLKQATKADLSDKQLLSYIREASRQKNQNEPGMPNFSSLDKVVANADGLSGLRQAEQLFGTGKTEQGIQVLERMQTNNAVGAYKRARLLISAYLSNHQTDKALAEARKLVKAHPKSASVHDLLGGVLTIAGQNEEAQKTYQTALKLNPKRASTLLNLAHLAVKENNAEGARKYYEQTLKISPQNTAALVGLARLADRQGQTQKALDYAEKARAADPNAVLPRLVLATYYGRRGQLKKAREIAREAVQAAPNQPAALNTLGVTEIELKKYQAAITQLKKAVQNAPKAPVYRANLGRAQMLLGHYKSARSNLQQVVAQAPDYVPGVGLLSVLEMRTGHKDKALALARKLRSGNNNKNQEVSYRLQGDLLMASRDYSKAIQSYEQAFKLQPSHLLVAKLFGARAQAGVGSADQVALDWLNKHPKDASIRLMLAQYYLSKKNYSKSTSEFEHLAKEHPDNPAILNNLAWLYGQQGSAKALDYAHKAHKLAPHAAPIIDTYGWLLVEKGKLEQGVKLLKQAHKQAPNSGDIRYHLAAAYVKTGQRQKAQTMLKKLLDSKTAMDNRDAAQKLYQRLTAGG